MEICETLALTKHFMMTTDKITNTHQSSIASHAPLEILPLLKWVKILLVKLSGSAWGFLKDLLVRGNVRCVPGGCAL